MWNIQLQEHMKFRGNVVDAGNRKTAHTWDAQSFAGFFYDIKNNRSDRDLYR